MTNSTTAFKFHVLSRDISGDNVGKIRKNGYIPANIFGLSKPSISIKCAKKLVQKQQKDIESGLLYIILDKKQEIPVLLEEIQRNPVTKEPLHITFKRVDLAEKIETSIPLELVGECDVKDANVLLVRDEIPIEALPSDIPEKITIDISSLSEIGQSLGVSELQFDRSAVEIKLSQEELDSPLVIVQEQKEEIEETLEETQVEAGEAGEGGGETAPEDEAGSKAEADPAASSDKE